MIHPRKNRLTKRSNINTFDDLFKDKNDIPYCLNALRLVIPAVVNDSEEYLHKSKKGPIVAWKNVLSVFGYIHSVNNQTVADILNVKFKNLNIREESFRTVQSRVYLEYLLQFKYKINPKILND
jgi:hypothetical protein